MRTSYFSHATAFLPSSLVLVSGQWARVCTGSRRATRPYVRRASAKPLPPIAALLRPDPYETPRITASPVPKEKALWTYAWPRALLLLVAAVWGTNFATVKLVQTGVDAVPLGAAAFARFGLATAVLAPFAVREHRTKPKLSQKVRGVNFIPEAVGIGLALCIGYGAQSVSLMTTEANKSAFICSLAVVIVPLLERVLKASGHVEERAKGEEDSSSLDWGAPLLAVVGVGLLELGGASAPSQGDLWALVQAFGFAVGFIGNAKALARHPHLTLSITTVQLATVAAFSAIWAGAESSLAAHAFALPNITAAVSTPANAAAVVYAGVITTAATVWLENVALAHVSASELTMLLSTEPFWAAAFSSVLLGESMGVQALLGGTVILAACIWNQSKQLGLGARIDNRGGLVARLGSVFAMIQMAFKGDVPPPPA